MGDGKMYLVGQEKNKELIDSGKLDNSSFIIIKGPTNYGKTYLTKYIANHYDMEYVLLDNKVDTIRQLVESSNKDNNCLYHFKDFDKSSAAAKAALLKIAEETPKGVKIVVTTSAYNFLGTLVSRAYNMNISAYTSENIEEYINILNFDKELLNRLKMSLNAMLTPTILKRYKEKEDLEEIINLVEDTINMLINGINLESIDKICKEFWKDDRDKVEIYLNLLKNAVLTRVSNSVIYFIVPIEKAEYTLNKVAITNYKQLLHNMFMEMVG